MTKNYHICAKRDKHLPFDVLSGSSITQGCHVWHNCGSFLSFTQLEPSPMLEHLQPFEAPGPKSGDIFAQIGCKTGVGGSKLPVAPRRSRM
jgi:hypothetical protein